MVFPADRTGIVSGRSIVVAGGGHAPCHDAPAAGASSRFRGNGRGPLAMARNARPRRGATGANNIGDCGRALARLTSLPGVGWHSYSGKLQRVYGLKNVSAF